MNNKTVCLTLFNNNNVKRDTPAHFVKIHQHVGLLKTIFELVRVSLYNATRHGKNFVICCGCVLCIYVRGAKNCKLA